MMNKLNEVNDRKILKKISNKKCELDALMRKLTISNKKRKL